MCFFFFYLFFCPLQHTQKHTPLAFSTQLTQRKMLAKNSHLQNKKLCECVCNHANRRRFRADFVGGLSFFVFQRIILGDGQGEGADVDPVELEDNDIRDIEECYVPASVFNGSLEATLRKELFTRNSSAAMPPPGALIFDYSRGVPVLLSLLTAAIFKLGGERVEGVFRVAAPKEDVDHAMREIEGGDYRAIAVGVEGEGGDLDKNKGNSGGYKGFKVTNPLVAADLLERWLSRMKGSLIPMELYGRCVADGSSGSSPDFALDILKDLEPANRACIEHLCNFGYRLSLSAPRTKTGIGDVAQVFCPALLKIPGSAEREREGGGAEDSKIRFVKSLIVSVGSRN